jgi:hypothetical protein
MGFIKNLFQPQAAKSAPAPAPKAAAQYPPVPARLPKITAPTAAQIAQTSQPSPAAQQILAANPQQTPSQYLGALQEKQMGPDMTKTLAHGMPDREGVHWAAQSADKVSDKLPPHELQGMKAAQAWAKSPTPENQAAAAAAAAQGGCRGPGSMAAQGAAWAQPGTPATPGAAAAPRLTPDAVAGSVLMSSAIKANPAVTVPTMTAPAAQAPAFAAPSLQTPQLAAGAPQAPAVVPPEVQAQTFQQQHPFIKMGLDIASGKTPVA